MIPTDVVGGRRANIAIAGVLAVLGLLLALDLALDLRRGTNAFHVVVEGLAIATAGLGVTLIARQLHAAMRQAQELRERARALTSNLDASRREAERWRREASAFIAGFGEAIEEQFARWSLTEAEKDVALLLLKGLEHKEIAGLRGVSETTVRQQAGAVYRKGGLTGRHDLAAFFLEDVLAPRSPSAG